MVKHEGHFWEAVLDQITKTDASIEPANIAYFDDRQSLVGRAREHSIAAFLYQSPDQVQNEILVARF